ncbi:MAG: hypothetical protein ABIU58_09800 [Ramlibacter sp.]
MPQTDFEEFEAKTANDRTVMHVLYGLHTLAWVSAGALAVIALIVNYVKRGDEHDAIYASHHNYMISTFWWTLVWLLLASPLWLLLFIPGAIAYTVIGLWYLYRCLRGWLRFSDGRPPF